MRHFVLPAERYSLVNATGAIQPNPSGIMLLTQAPGYTAGYLGCGTAYKNSTGTNLYWDYIAYKVRIKLNSLSYKHKELA